MIQRGSSGTEASLLGRFCSLHSRLQRKRGRREQLEKLSGIGSTTAKAIIRFREIHDPFKRVEDLLAIHGTSKAHLEKLPPYVTVAPAPAEIANRIGLTILKFHIVNLRFPAGKQTLERLMTSFLGANR